jgi:glycosyltransferase involved in cell wall biosynthesis
VNKPLVSVITASTGNPLLANCLHSVKDQTYSNIQHLVFVDGPERSTAVYAEIEESAIQYNPREGYRFDLIELPYSIGKDRWNGHRMYGAANFIAEGEYFIWLDDDNFLHPDHIENLVNLVQKENLDWAFSFRNIVDKNHGFICEDNCESLGLWKSVLNDNFVDVNCYFVKKQLSIQLAPLWYRKAREPGVPEIDRILPVVLFDPKNKLKYNTTKKYTVNYTVANNPISVQPEFFERGNAEMLRRYNGVLPWKDKI